MSFNLENQAQPVPVSLINPAAPTGWHEPEEAYARRRRRPRAADRRGRGHKEVETPVTRELSHGSTTRRAVHSGGRRIPDLYQRTLLDGSTVYEFNGRLGGRMRRHRLDAQTKTDAIAEAAALRVDHKRGTVQLRSRSAPTLTMLADDWVATLQARVGVRDPRRRFSERTVVLYRSRLDRHVLPELGRRHAADITVDDVRRLIDKLTAKRLAPSTVTATVNILSGLLRYAVKHGYADRNVVRDLDKDDRPGAARQTEPRYLTTAEVDLLLAETSDTFRPVATACAYAALRVSEALGLRWRDVDFKAGTLTVSGQLGLHGERVAVKTPASAASVPLLPALARELQTHRSRQASKDLRRVHADAFVFTTSRGKPQSRRAVLRAVQRAADKAGLNSDGRDRVRVHDLRHSYVAAAFDSGASLPQVSALARHASSRVTAQVYAGLAEDGRAKAAAKLVDAGFGS